MQYAYTNTNARTAKIIIITLFDKRMYLRTDLLFVKEYNPKRKVCFTVNANTESRNEKRLLFLLSLNSTIINIRDRSSCSKTISIMYYMYQ